MMPWWMWIVVGLGLLGFEVLTPGGFFFFFFGVSGLLVGMLAGFDLVEETWLQVLLFSGFAIVALLLFRNRLLRLLGSQPKTPPMADIEGELAVLLQDLDVDATGKAELRGVPWNAQNTDRKPLNKGQRCKVVRVEGLVLFIKAE